ncbi:hypothetical protein HPB49_004125 [Dermacentor silvarum]|uniref:Uncharacterized protein n=1 Tax=Dermacentor silvarum TaxID=543639 RepID=A0ACB8DUH3_DERSI|nr:hypothetical protein HPB49_004125 [Dermacentor silvarum]
MICEAVNVAVAPVKRSKFEGSGPYGRFAYHSASSSWRATRLRLASAARSSLNAYQTSKQTLVRRFTPSEPERLRPLLDMDLGNHTPSQLLYHMQRLVGSVTGLDSTLLLEIFLQPATPSVYVVNVQAESASASSSNEFLQLCEEIARLTDTVASLHESTACRLKQRTAPPQQPRLCWCWYHRKHGDAARKCVASCDYPGNVRPCGVVKRDAQFDTKAAAESYSRRDGGGAAVFGERVSGFPVSRGFRRSVRGSSAVALKPTPRRWTTPMPRLSANGADAPIVIGRTMGEGDVGDAFRYVRGR